MAIGSRSPSRIAAKAVDHGPYPPRPGVLARSVTSSSMPSPVEPGRQGVDIKMHQERGAKVLGKGHRAD